jgi:membrane-associated phospholipid phosphatase
MFSKVLSIYYWHFIFFIAANVFFLAANAQNFEMRLLIKINKNDNKNFTNVMKGFSVSMMPVSLSTPVAIFYEERKNKSKPNTWNAVGAIVTTGIVTQILKSTVKRPRPFQTYPTIIKRSDAGGYSFPSGHSSLSFCAATTLALHYKKWEVAVPAFAWAATVAYSRMQLGVHYPTDVLAGIAIGILAPVAVWKISDRVRRK